MLLLRQIVLFILHDKKSIKKYFWNDIYLLQKNILGVRASPLKMFPIYLSE